jgi:hypothetical protein
MNYQELKENSLREISRAEECVRVNEILKEYNWAFIHPWLQGGHISHFEKLSMSGELTAEIIFNCFCFQFFELRNTAYFIDAHFKQNPHLKPFCQLIDQSVILCLQRDYAGAINTLPPVIEGSIRHFLVNNKNKKNEKIMKLEDLTKVFYHVKCDCLEKTEKYYRQTWPDNYILTKLTDQEIENLLRLKAKYLDLWFSIIEGYFGNNLYFDTRKGTTHDNLNRHAIFHGFNADVYYNLQNYLRIYNCIIFLNWVLMMSEPEYKILPELNEKESYYKWKAFEKIRAISRISMEIKASVYEKYEDFDKTQFCQIIQPPNKFADAIEAFPLGGVERRLRLIDKVIGKVSKRK